MNKTIYEVIEEYSFLNSNSLCIVDDSAEYSYGSVVKLAREAGTAISSFGVLKGDRVAIICTQNAQFLITLLACNAIGAVAVPIEKGASNNRIEEIIRETEVLLVVSDNHYEMNERFKSCRYSQLFDETELERKVCFPSVDLNDTAEILFTTGSTGKSKGIEITFDNDIALAENICAGTEMRVNNVELIPLPLSHSHALRTFYANMMKNGTVIITDGIMNVKRIYDLIKNYNVTAIDLSPSAALVLLKLSKGKFTEFDNQLDYIELGTSVLPEDTKEQLKNQFPNTRLYNCYGSTESGRSCILNFNSEDDMPYCLGTPSINAEFIVVDDEKKPIESSPTNTGLLACKGRMNMKGYWKQPELTAQTMSNGYVYTNDEGYIGEDGRLFLYGRRGDVINYKGIKIAPDEIEEIIKKYGEPIIDCALVPEKDELAGHIPVLVLQLGETDLDIQDLNRYIAGNIDDNKRPKRILSFDSIPRTYNGKLQRMKLIKDMEAYPQKVFCLK